jgi:3-oxoacyl-[acyl-carrier protein] reductase
MDGRRALVTGASGGIGRALAQALATAGADVILSYSGHRAEAEAAAAAVASQGRSATVLHADLSRPGAGRELAAQAGPVDVLVANAGAGTQRPWAEVDDDLWAQTFAVNVTAVWQLTSSLLPQMVQRRFGRVLFVSSVAALTGGVIGPHYAASKAALHGLMHHLAPRVAGSGVTVNTIAPALIEGTWMLPGDPGDLAAGVPVGRLGQPAEVADMAVAMLTSPYLTSKVITLDGGIHPR